MSPKPTFSTPWMEWIYTHSAFRYVISGGTAAVVHFAVLTTLVELFSVNPTIATSIGFVIGSTVNYTLQYHWTFDADGPHHVMFTRYASVTATTLSINAGLFWTFTNVFGIFYLIAQVISTGLMVVVNYLINKHFTFVSLPEKNPAEEQPAASD